MNKDKERPQKKHLKLVERYDSDDYSRYAGPDYSDEPFELGEQDFEHSPHTKRNINIREQGSWSHPGVSGKTDDETWVNQKEYKKQTDFVGYGPRGYKRSDDRIYEEVCEALMRHPDVDASDIGVTVDDGMVYLTGKVASRRMKKTAELVAEDLPGVQDVKNELNIITRNTDDKGPDSATKKDLGIY
jgi:hypothetical protein